MTVPRTRLVERLDAGMRRRLILVSAPAGFGKTTLLGEWLAALPRSAAWLSLDEGDEDPARFVAYLVAALRTVAADIGEGVLGVLESSQPPTEPILTALLNEIDAIEDEFVLVLDDYHAIDAGAIDDALAFMLEHLPPRMHLVIATREDPRLPLARLRVRGQLTELRAADLRFTASEAAEFLNQVMGLSLSAPDRHRQRPVTHRLPPHPGLEGLRSVEGGRRRFWICKRRTAECSRFRGSTDSRVYGGNEMIDRIPETSPQTYVRIGGHVLQTHDSQNPQSENDVQRSRPLHITQVSTSTFQFISSWLLLKCC